MGKLDLAAERLTNAVNALDTGLVPLLEARGGGDESGTELAALRAERDNLLARIAVLEEELGTALFKRTPSGAALTARSGSPRPRSAAVT